MIVNHHDRTLFQSRLLGVPPSNRICTFTFTFAFKLSLSLLHFHFHTFTFAMIEHFSSFAFSFTLSLSPWQNTWILFQSRLLGVPDSILPIASAMGFPKVHNQFYHQQSSIINYQLSPTRSSASPSSSWPSPTSWSWSWSSWQRWQGKESQGSSRQTSCLSWLVSSFPSWPGTDHHHD